MAYILDALGRAFVLIASGNRELFAIIVLSLKVSGLALILATVLGLPVSGILAFKSFTGRGFVMTLLHTFMGFPPVVAGLFLYLLLSRSGPLGFLGLLYTPAAMVIAQTVLALPIVVSLSHAALRGVDQSINQAARTLGATPVQALATVIAEARYGIICAVAAAFGRVIAEVGAILIVGGNIAGYTRVMTTTIAMETDRGEFELALALGIILLSLSLGVNVLLSLFRRMGAGGDVEAAGGVPYL